ncbi:hypothetical protein CRENBAI_000257 [Crenichthys baileyi]|uniref:Uncharacterized protein n=1 Tax=Crenichthys baileyi TaxID=28760 RepID=A0AAV9S966_9TELE
MLPYTDIVWSRASRQDGDVGTHVVLSSIRAAPNQLRFIPTVGPNFHTLNAETPMETSKSATGTRRQLNATPTKLPPAKKQATESEVSLAAVLAAIKSLDNNVDDFGKQLQENSEMFACFTLQVEQNTFRIAECKSIMENFEQKLATINKENAALKEKLLEAERYKRRWNLRLLGLKEQEGEDLRKKGEQILSRILLQWANQADDVIDTIHRVGRKEDGRSCQVILQFTRRCHRDTVWKMTKDSAVCKEQGLRFAQDFIKEDRLAREELWPKITKARSQGKVAFYRGHVAVIDGKVIKASSPF